MQAAARFHFRSDSVTSASLIQKNAMAEAQRRMQSTHKRTGKHRKEYIILIVEAGETALSTRKLLLETAGLNVLSAVTAEQALTLLQRCSTDMAIVDNDIRDKPLRKFCDQLRRDFGLPVYILSPAQWIPDDLKDVADGHFEKMNDPQQLVEKVIESLGA